MRPEIDFAARNILGTRKKQEDFYAFEELASGGLLLVLADGVGGETGGELASRAAVEAFLDHFSLSSAPDTARFSLSLQRANESVARLIDDLPDGEIQMATTLLALRVENLELRWVSVGDSPLLLSRNGGLLRLNADHSGRAEDYQSTLARNELASALTGGRIRLVDLPGEPYPLERGDLILAASDGLWTLTLSEISSLLHAHAESHTSEIASRLLTEIERKGKSSQDNATIAIIRIA